ncbi:MAG: hypothetical protein M0009_15595 [Deltaproteobacteria bacterium]|nr:hypothetical protein [Deltaproteobacteria bacterium]
MVKGFKMGKYRSLRKLKCLRKSNAAIVARHCPTVARIDLATFDVRHRNDFVCGIEALPLVDLGSAIIPNHDTS